ncbi:hypothetical protein GCM10008090_01290 [Arenicella chitinivorans]|uniref:Uncharacterized protein n=1 Tax=Arenicella chitinivorans TaxID=1329800 RepID=A0A918RFI5_9GAMM|nr:hypothetical protein [Arenicella chitinivorans]GGZ96792.1 hypothetical protein GCM10008090_01290 [Arenicella chitinivorans]
MSDDNKPHNVLNEMAVFDYVAGNQSDENRTNFERLITDSRPLRESVADEQLLRAALKDYARNNSTPLHLSSENFQDLLRHIDELAAESDDDLRFLPPRESSTWSVIGGVAATLLLCATLFLDWYSRQHQPERVLPSRPASYPDLGELISEQRALQITFARTADHEAISKLMQRYQLQPVSHTGAAWVAFSATPLSIAQLSEINSRGDTISVRIITFSDR